MRSWQIAFAIVLMVYVPLRFLTDLAWWEAGVVTVSFSLGLYVFIDWLRATQEPPDPRQRWRR